MSITQEYPFDTAGNYTISDANKAEVTLSTARTRLVDLTSQTFNQDFSSSTGFTFDAGLTEFSGGQLQQLDVTPTNSVFGGTYTSSLDLDWHKGGGSLTATLNGVPTNVGGRLVCTGTQGVSYTRSSSAIETHKFIYTPNYTTSPPGNINIVSTWNGSNNNDRFNLTHSPSGNTLRLTLYDSTGSSIIAVATTVGGAYAPTASTDYEFEVVIDSSSGTVRVFIDGVLHGTNSPGAWTRSSTATTASLGANASIYNQGEASFDDYILFSDAQHTVGYTPGYSVSTTIYQTDTIDAPQFSYSGIGAVQAYTGFTVTDSGARYTFNGEYWTGSAWAASDGSFAQANTAADINTNVPTATASDTVDIQIVTDDTNTQASVDDLTVTYTGQEYPQDNPYIEPAQTFQMDGLDGFTETSTKPAGSAIQYVLFKGTDPYYWTGAVWAISDGTYAQSSTAADIETNKATFTTTPITFKWRAFLNTDGSVNPLLDNLSVTYDFAAPTDDTIEQCIVFGTLKDGLGNAVSNQVVSAELDKEYVKYKTNIMVTSRKVSTTTDSNGKFELNLIETANMDGDPKYKFIIIEDTALRSVPNETSKNYVDLT